MDLPCVQFLQATSTYCWVLTPWIIEFTNAWPNTYWNKVVVLMLWTDDSDNNNTINTSETNVVVYQ